MLIDLLSYIINLALYPLVLVPFFIPLLNRGVLSNKNLKGVLSLFYCSGVLALSVLLQLIFQQSRIVDTLHHRTKEAIMLFLSLGFFWGVSLVLIFLIRYLVRICNENKKRGFLILAERVCHFIVFTLLGLLSVFYILFYIPSISFFETFIPVLFTAYLIVQLVCLIFIFILIFINRKEPFFRLFVIWGCGLILFITALLILPSLIQPLIPPLAIAFHYAVLFLIFRTVKGGNPASVLSSPKSTSIQLKEAGLSDREIDVAMELLEGYSYKAISQRLYISLSTVQTHVTRIYKKLDINSKMQLQKWINSRIKG